MITIGVDAHKRLHVALALDAAGREIGEWRGPNNSSGWRALSEWARAQGEELQWGIEGAWGYGRQLAQHLVAGAEIVYEINPRWTAFSRRRGRRQGKTDSLDARAVALLVRQEAPGLPRVSSEDSTALLDLWTTERASAIAAATRLRNQIHSLLVQLDPEYHLRLPTLKSKRGAKALQTYECQSGEPLAVERAAAVRMLGQRLLLALVHADSLAAKIRQLPRTRCAALTRLCGIDLLTAGALAEILGPGRRFETDAQLAAYAGVAPLEASSAGLVRHRLNRGGNRHLNAILYRITLTQAHYSSAARTYLDRRIGEGKSRREAIRALKRYIIRAIWRLWLECESVLALPSLAAVA